LKPTEITFELYGKSSEDYHIIFGWCILMLRKLLVTALLLYGVASPGMAEIKIENLELETGKYALLLSGDFELSDNVDALTQAVRSTGATFITFNSDGGNVVTAIKYGRIIRHLGLSTMQLRSGNCASACALAFLGGVERFAEAGSIGVHQASFTDNVVIGGHYAVAAVQSLTAEILHYLQDMGVDSALLQLSLSIPSNDMRYMTAAEMESYRVTVRSSRTSVRGNGAQTTTLIDVSPPTAEPNFVPPQNDDTRAVAFIHAYHEALSHPNNVTLEYMSNAYASDVSFYGEIVPKQVVLEEKRKFIERWPVRTYSVRSDSISLDCASICRVAGVLDWYTTRNQGQNRSSGTAEFNLAWNPVSGLITSEAGKVLSSDRATSSPSLIISQWQELNSSCRGGAGDDPKTLLSCEYRERVSEKLNRVGWCYGKEGDYGYQMEWHECGVVSNSTSPVMSVAVSSQKVSRPDGGKYTIKTKYSAKVILPDFKGRDREFNRFRTRIRNGMKEGPNFASHYSLVQIGCGTGCTFALVGKTAVCIHSPEVVRRTCTCHWIMIASRHY
jgi:hypothetical protein